MNLSQEDQHTKDNKDNKGHPLRLLIGRRVQFEVSIRKKGGGCADIEGVKTVADLGEAKLSAIIVLARHTRLGEGNIHCFELDHAIQQRSKIGSGGKEGRNGAHGKIVVNGHDGQCRRVERKDGVLVHLP